MTSPRAGQVLPHLTHTKVPGKIPAQLIPHCSHLTKWALLISEPSFETCTVVIWKIKGIQQQQMAAGLGRDVMPSSLSCPLLHS